MRLLLVEDDLMLGEALQDALIPHDYLVEWAKSGECALKLLRSDSFDLIVLDIGLPGMDGIDVLKTLRREQFMQPVLLLTARDEQHEKISGLDAGADDYLLKPFDLGELLARLRALSRRVAGRATPIITHGKLSINTDDHSIQYDGCNIVLSRQEYRLLIKLIENTGRILSREQIEQSLYGWADDVESNALEVHIHHIRKKIPFDLIRTVRGIGYTINKWSNSAE